MSKPNFYRFKRKVGNTNNADAPVSKQAKKSEKSKNQITISKFFLPVSKPSSSTVSKTVNGASTSPTTVAAVAAHEEESKKESNSVKRTSLGQNTAAKLKKFILHADESENNVCDIKPSKKEIIQTEKPDETKEGSTTNKLSAFASKHVGTSTKPTVSSADVKYTPFEQQIVSLKSKYPAMMLLVETGYKYRFFGDDAKIASEELNIMASQDHHFLTASIPTHRLHVHVTRLVQNGHKVGVVKQTETTALKASSSSKSSIFSRQLAAVYTKATLIGEDVDGATSSQQEITDKVCSLACIAEAPRQGKEGRLCDIGILVLEPTTGETMFDSFVDLPNRAELEKRLLITRPVEIIMSKNVSEATRQLVHSNKLCRVETLDDKLFDFTNGVLVAAEFLTDEAKAKLGALHPTVIAALSALLQHLQEFGLTKALNPQGMRKFTDDNTALHMDAGTVKNLELFESSLPNNKGSLLWTLDHTKTSFGSRLLQRWIAQPLKSLEPLIVRQESVTELLRPECADLVLSLQTMLAKLPDLERDLTCVLHGKSNTSSFASLVGCLSQLYVKLKSMQSEIWCCLTDEYIEDLFKQILENLEDIQGVEENLDFKAAKESDKTKLLKNWSKFPDVVKQQEKISEIEKQLDALRPSVARTLGMMSIKYATVSGLEFLIELKNNVKVPSHWSKISSTKQVSRWRPSEVGALFNELCRHREMLVAACNEAWQCTLSAFSRSYHSHKTAVRSLATLDVLIALAAVSKQHGFCRPVLKEGSPCIEIKQGRHPILTHLFCDSQEVVANDTYLGSPHERCMIITGPNMGGKSSYIRQVALLVIMAQLGCYIPAESATISLVDAIFTRMGSRDDLQHGRSTLLVELEEACNILHHATPHSLAILDELGRGTSSCDGAALAVSSLQHLMENVGCMVVFVTHYPVVMTLEQQLPLLANNYHLAFTVKEGVLMFLYKVTRGGAEQSYGLNVARLANLPPQILEVAAHKAQQLEQQVVVSSRRCKNFVRLLQCRDVANLRQELQTYRN